VLDEAACLRGGAEYAGGTAAPISELGFMLSALCHDFGKAVTTAAGEDGRVHALEHEVKGLPLAEAFLRRMTGNRKLLHYVLNMTEHHMKPNILAADRSRKKSTNRMFDRSADPEGLILLAKADCLGKNHGNDHEDFLWQRLQNYRRIMEAPHVEGKDLAAAGFAPGPAFGEALEYAHKLRLAEVPKEEALRQTLSFMRKSAR